MSATTTLQAFCQYQGVLCVQSYLADITYFWPLLQRRSLHDLQMLTVHSTLCKLVQTCESLTCHEINLVIKVVTMYFKFMWSNCLQAIHHKVHFLIQSSLQTSQDSSKGPIQPQALLALCCSLQILEVRLGAPPLQPVLAVQQKQLAS